MDMELPEEFSDRGVVRRKRTKRLSPSSSSGGADGDHSNPSSLISSSPTTSESTESEDEGIAASCLILLARGGFTPVEKKFTTRKFTEMATAGGDFTGDGKVGIYVYECRTCNRTFPSFQALGGHRASHKKPKTAADQIDGKKSPPPLPENKFNNAGATTPPPPLMTTIEINKHKIHECSICGSEFASGQALGGHMRRHRPVNTTTAASKISNAAEKTRGAVFALDLNLPAPPEESDADQFRQFSPHLVLSAAPGLVNCHY